MFSWCLAPAGANGICSWSPSVPGWGCSLEHRDKRCLPEQLVPVCDHCELDPHCCRASKKLNMTLEIWCASVGTSAKEPPLSPVLLPYLFTHSSWLQCQKELFNHLFFSEERRSREIGGCTSAEVGGGGDGGKYSGLCWHSVLTTAQARQAALISVVILWNFSLQKLVHRENNTEQRYQSAGTAPASYFLPPSTSSSNCISPVHWQQIGVGC